MKPDDNSEDKLDKQIARFLRKNKAVNYCIITLGKITFFLHPLGWYVLRDDHIRRTLLSKEYRAGLLEDAII